MPHCFCVLGGSVAAAQEPAAPSSPKTGDDSPSATAKTQAGKETGDQSAKESTTGKASPKARSKVKPEEEFVRKTDAEWRKNS